MEHDEIAALVMTLPDATRRDAGGGLEFRVRGKAFATLAEDGTLALKLTAEQQDMLEKSEPGRFKPSKDGWGFHGWTEAKPGSLDEASALSVLMIAWSNVAPAELARSDTQPRDHWRF